MFNVNLRNTDYRIVFQYEEYNPPLVLAPKVFVSHTTDCYIVKNKERVDGARAFCSIKDRFNKNVGRKKALEFLLAYSEMDFTREERKSIWDAYFAARNGRV